jgi:hypothetical protein
MVTVIGPVVAPAGTVVTIEPVVGVPVIVAVVALNCTIMLAGSVLKFAPVMVTVSPTTPDAGVKLAITGSGPSRLEPQPESAKLNNIKAKKLNIKRATFKILILPPN